jgi:hypothetical protein
MQTGLNHLHTNFAHLLVLMAFINMILAVLGAAKKPGLAKMMKMTHRFGILALGRVIYVAGLGVAMVGGFSFTSPWILAGLLLWGAVEVAGKRMIAAELDGVVEGGAGSPKLLVGSAIQLFVIVTVYSLMQMKPVL